MTSRSQKEFGDFQTPPALALSCLERLQSILDWSPSLVLEPTCGRGAFVSAAARCFGEARIVGVDKESVYVSEAAFSAAKANPRAAVEVLARDFFEYGWDQEIARNEGRLLVVGNPPWVTNALLGRFGSSNLPTKRNFQSLKGLDAITGKANFDISEWMLLQYIQWVLPSRGAFAVLCKTSVARKIAKQIWKRHAGHTRQLLFRIDAKESFGVSVDACFYVVAFDAEGSDNICHVHASLRATHPHESFGVVDGALVSDVNAARSLSALRGPTTHRWRSGVKHDCSDILELRKHPEGLKNGLGETVAIEGHATYPLLKSSDVFAGVFRDKYIVLPQANLKDDPEKHLKGAPATWRYLQNHRPRFDKRSSRIYKARPPFSIFGVGDYTFLPWKIAVSGLHKALEFRLFGPVNGQPVVFDDAVSFLGFTDEVEARRTAGLLRSDIAKSFLHAQIFWDEKRPVTIEVLSRLSIEKLADFLHPQVSQASKTAVEHAA